MKKHTCSLTQFVEKIKAAIKAAREKIFYRTRQNNIADLISLTTENDTIWLTLGNGKASQTLSIPIPKNQENGNLVIEKEHVVRACGTWLVVADNSIGDATVGEEYDFFSLVYWTLTSNVENYFPTSSKRVHLDRLLYSFEYNSSPLVFKNLQRLVDDIVNKLPLVGTDMQAWAMCHRVQILDPTWDSMTPKQMLSYQKDLNEKLFPWTSLGQSDSGMCNNTILKTDIRRTVPFGLSHHNPRRNLYQTLGMKGDETPIVVSQTESALEKQGVVRKGWNFMTAFIDLPLNFEDQIIVNSKHANLHVTETKGYTCFGTTIVEEGDKVHFLHPLSMEADGTVIRFGIKAESATVLSISDINVNFNGGKTKAKRIVVEYKRLFKDGFKLTNRHGNKGVIFMTDTGVVRDPMRGDIPIDVIVSAQSVMKRKNFGQLFEAISTLISGKEKRMVAKDDFVAHTDKVRKSLLEAGYNEDGTCPISTRWGNFSAICGWVHWGCIKTPEDQIWTKRDTNSTNNKDIRTAGNKISHIELRALVTIFGKSNPIVQEILEHWQGHDQVFELLKIIDTMRNVYPDLPVLEWSDIRPLDQREGFFHDLHELVGTVSDETMHSNGFYIKLPDGIKYVIRKMENGKFAEDLVTDGTILDSKCVVMDKILVAPGSMRKPWKHQTGKYGLTDVASLVNPVVRAIHRYKNDEGPVEQIGRTIFLYFHGVSEMLSTKTGMISSYCMAVRYPYTVKAVAAVGEDLEPNEIEVNELLARDLRVKTGDFVIVERFPCLGFMSMRVQKVKVSYDANSTYVVRVSGNSLASLALDFDGDVLYLMSFHDIRSKEALKNEFNNPHKDRLDAYTKASDKKVPCIKEMKLDDYKVEIFPAITKEQNGDIVEGLTGIKRGTGTIIALCYNIMRIIERNIGYSDETTAIAMELLLDKVANSVFSMKHAGRSLEEECRKAICTADVERMLDLGFDPTASVTLSNLIKKLSGEVGIYPDNLNNYFLRSEARGRSSVINLIIRKFHKVWLTSRSNMHPITVLSNLDSMPEDLTGWMFHLAKKRLEKKYAGSNS